jgi:hypothetical protein
LLVFEDTQHGVDCSTYKNSQLKVMARKPLNFDKCSIDRRMKMNLSNSLCLEYKKKLKQVVALPEMHHCTAQS